MNRYQILSRIVGVHHATIYHHTRHEAYMMYVANGGTIPLDNIEFETFNADGITVPSVLFMYANGKYFEYLTKEFVNPDNYTRNTFDKVEITQDILSRAGRLMVSAGAVGYIVSEFDGYGVVFDTKEPLNVGKLIRSRASDQFLVDFISPSMVKKIKK